MKIKQLIKELEDGAFDLRESCREMKTQYKNGLIGDPEIAIAKRAGMAMGFERAAQILRERTEADNIRQRERYWRLKNEKP